MENGSQIPPLFAMTMSMDFGITNEFWQAGKFTNMKPANSEDLLYLLRAMNLW